MTGYRTILVAAVTMILGAVQSIEGMIPAEYAGLALQVVGGLGILLRFLTTGPVPLKEKPSTTVSIPSVWVKPFPQPSTTTTATDLPSFGDSYPSHPETGYTNPSNI